MPEILRCVHGPWDGGYVEAASGQGVYTSEPINGISLRYVRQGSQLVFDGLIVERPYVERGLAQLEQYAAAKSLEAA